MLHKGKGWKGLEEVVNTPSVRFLVFGLLALGLPKFTILYRAEFFLKFSD